MKVLVTGAAGMLGTAILDRLLNQFELFATDLNPGFKNNQIIWNTCNLLDFEQLDTLIHKIKPHYLIHCAAFVSLDFCEENKDTALKLHADSTERISQHLEHWNGKLIYISTDSVFNGLKETPYVESDSPEPLNIYAQTKLQGEKNALKNKNNIVLRTNIFGWSRDEKLSFAEWLLKGLMTKEERNMFTDVYYSPIHVSLLADIIVNIIDSNITGLYHASGSTPISKYEFAKLLIDAFEIDSPVLNKTNVDDVKFSTARPKNMSLNNSLLEKALNRPLPSAIQSIDIFKEQIDSLWLAKIKNRPIAESYQFWEK